MPLHPLGDEQVEVTQADREAAAVVRARGIYDTDKVSAEMMRHGELDSSSLVQAFARHRLACSAPSALPEDDGKLRKLIFNLKNWDAGADRHTQELLLDTAHTLETLSREIKRANARLADARRVIEYGFPRQFPVGQKCEHGRLSCEDCIGCYDKALIAAIEGRSLSTGSAAKRTTS